MGKRRNWIDLVKRIFGSDNKSKQEKKERRKRWLFGRLKSKRPITFPATSLGKTKTLRQVEEEQSKHALAVAVATAAAAEVAVAAAQAAAEVVRLTGTPMSYNKARENAAIKIQTAFRGYLARKALRALRGLVKLQALVRGRAVRRQTSATLKRLQSLIKIQEQVRAHRIHISGDDRDSEGKEHMHLTSKDLGGRSIKRNDKQWEGSSLSKKAIDAILINRQEAAFKRERAMEYAYSQQRNMNPCRHSLCTAKELETDRMSPRLSWLEQWVETQPWDRDIPEIFPVPSPSPDKRFHHLQHHIRDSQACVDSLQRSLDDLPQLRPVMRRLFNRSRRSFVRDDESFISSPSFPNYMTFTESAKARARSMSTPKQRIAATDILSHPRAPCANRQSSPFPSVCSEAAFAKPSRFQQATRDLQV
uniref:Protein IQ-DOMAIN 14 n=1 Tax=Anthurium amnicola TaxID=1678845 RepID=A0A1D1YZ25_9ARAE